jgi:hypothetical protein
LHEIESAQSHRHCFYLLYISMKLNVVVVVVVVIWLVGLRNVFYLRIAKSHLHPNYQNPPAQCPRSAPNGGKMAISTQTIKTHLHSAPDQPPMAEEWPSPPKPTYTVPQSAPNGRKIAISTQTIKTHLHSAPDQPPTAEKLPSPPKPSKPTCTVPQISP